MTEQMKRISNAAIEKATGKTWKEWLSLLWQGVLATLTEDGHQP